MRPLIVAVALCLFTAACSNTRTIESLTPVADDSRPGRGAVAAPAQPPAPAEDGRSIFVANCTGCHGRNADGDTPAGRAWRVPNLRSPQVQGLSDQQLLLVLHQGKGKMPAWSGLLSDTDINHLLAYVRSLK